MELYLIILTVAVSAINNFNYTIPKTISYCCFSVVVVCSSVSLFEMNEGDGGAAGVKGHMMTLLWLCLFIMYYIQYMPMKLHFCMMRITGNNIILIVGLRDSQRVTMY